MTEEYMENPQIVVVGMGYVGLTLASHIATLGLKIHGIEKNTKTVDVLNSCNLHLNEPGVEEAIANHMNKNWTVGTNYSFRPDVIVVCVSTPINDSGSPNLQNINDSVSAMEAFITKDTLIIIRSTVPIGTTRVIAETFLKGKTQLVAFCPERTIQGQALREIRELPQIVGGYNEESTNAAIAFFSKCNIQTRRVSSLEVAEMVKLSNNCHTDLIYSFGNEIALIAQSHNIDPMEVISAANSDYPRPNLAIPGFVGGACLSKDPYIMCASVDLQKNKALFLIPSARQLNEFMPSHTASHLLGILEDNIPDFKDNKTVFICGFAYKGIPETDDLRGAPIFPFIEVLKQNGVTVLGHDPVIAESIIEEIGAKPVSIEEGMQTAQNVVFLNNHRHYSALNLNELLGHCKKPFVVYDCWRIFKKEDVLINDGVIYAGIGYQSKK